ncbi:MAG: hypothetical protein FWD57_07375, partial [Polyangiaceae bacterium]|nr:hypothetical protein [Polyangiaceae bacterium]
NPRSAGHRGPTQGPASDKYVVSGGLLLPDRWCAPIPDRANLQSEPRTPNVPTETQENGAREGT